MRARTQGPSRGRRPGPRRRPPRPAPGPPRQRRALSGLGGPIATRSAEPALRPLADALAEVLAAADRAQGADRLTHGFHSYPARMHPDLAAAAIARFSRPGARVLDPFCGGGTVLVEALVAGRKACGVDLSPLAVWLSALRCDLRDAGSRGRFAATLERVTEASLERVRARVPARAPLGPRERSYYAPHVLLELAGLREEILQVREEVDRDALLLVLSSLLVKLSNQRGDTSEGGVVKRLRKGLASELFLRKGRELCERWAALFAAAGPSAVRPRIVAGDARELPHLLGKGERFDLVLSSPPYGGTYDYVDHHARRYPWLGLDPSALERGELGARRRYAHHDPSAPDRFADELRAALRAIAALCTPSTEIVLLLGDAELGGRRVDALEQLHALAPAAGLRLTASASQPRRDARGGPLRGEHLLLLRRAAG